MKLSLQCACSSPVAHRRRNAAATSPAPLSHLRSPPCLAPLSPPVPCRHTAQGLEPQTGINHIAHFYLTQQLLPALTGHGTPARVVVVASKAHGAFGDDVLDADDLNWEKRTAAGEAAAGRGLLDWGDSGRKERIRNEVRAARLGLA